MCYVVLSWGGEQSVAQYYIAGGAMTPMSTELQDKISYIQHEVWRTTTAQKFLFITKTGIQAILKRPPFPVGVNLKKLSLTDFTKVQTLNDKLMVPMSVKTIGAVLKISRDYDNQIVQTITVEK